MVSQLALGAIWGYQRYLSPRKGFRCAHSVLHGGTGCSGFTKHAIRDHGFWASIPLIRARFADCRDASQTLRANCPIHANEADPGPRRGNPLRKKRGNPQKRKRGEDPGNESDCSHCDCSLWSLVPAFCAAGTASGGPGNAQPSAAPEPSGGDGCMPGDCSAPSCDGGGCDCSPSCG
ncbi:membrane protein insertion efficiency factor YidD [Gymnodinialimonas sp. 2305UL16-5]|uniref:membrane protein insertion efficiency factor YidD n=1 Tax=Gymnodinialimonas mytili TaxID=3126503 RepID=UPI00309EB6AA